jgi:hypothetical protein
VASFSSPRHSRRARRKPRRLAAAGRILNLIINSKMVARHYWQTVTLKRGQIVTPKMNCSSNPVRPFSGQGSRSFGSGQSETRIGHPRVTDCVWQHEHRRFLSGREPRGRSRRVRCSDGCNAADLLHRVRGGDRAGFGPAGDIFFRAGRHTGVVSFFSDFVFRFFHFFPFLPVIGRNRSGRRARSVSRRRSAPGIRDQHARTLSPATS